MAWYVRNAEEALPAEPARRERPRQRKGMPVGYGRDAFRRWAKLLSDKGNSLQDALDVPIGRIQGCGKYGCVVSSGPKRVLKLSPLPDNWKEDEELKFWTAMKREQKRPASPASSGVVKVDKVWVVTDKDTGEDYMAVLREEVEPFATMIPDPDSPPDKAWALPTPSDASQRRGITEIPRGVLAPYDIPYFDMPVAEEGLDPVLTAMNEYSLGDVHIGNIGWSGDHLVIYDADFAGEAPGPDEELRVNDRYSPFHEQLPGGLASGMRPEDFDAEQLERGIEAEVEHTQDESIATEIAMDHLVEDPRYYEKPEAIMEPNARSADDEFTRWSGSLDEEMREYAEAWRETWLAGGRPPDPPGDRFRDAADVRRRITALYPPPPAERRRRPGLRGNAPPFDPFDLESKSVAEELDERQRRAEQGNWVPASGGTEEPFRTRTGRRLQYVWQPSTGRHAYLDLDTDLILSDEEARLALGTYNSNARGFYVFEIRGGKPYRQVNVKPLTLTKAKQLARIGAQQGKHDRVVTTDPRKKDFRVVSEYEAGSR